MNRDLWLAERRTGLGASDAAAVLGLSPWQTPLGVYLDKTGQAPPAQETAPMRWGLLLEDAIATAYAQDTGRALVPGALTRHPDLDWLLATPDRHAEDRPVQLKTCNAFAADEWGEPGTDQIPEPYLVQVQHEMAVLGADLADVAVLIGGADFRIYTVPRNQELIDAMLKVEGDFWRRVQERRPPEPDFGHKTTPALLDALYAPDGGVVTLDRPEDREAARAYLRCRDDARQAERRKDEIRAYLTHRMGSAGRGLIPGGAVLTRKLISRKGYTVAPSEYTQFAVRPSSTPA